MNRGKLILFRSGGGPITIPNFPSHMFSDVSRMPGINNGVVMFEFDDGKGRRHTHYHDQVTGMAFEQY